MGTTNPVGKPFYSSNPEQKITRTQVEVPYKNNMYSVSCSNRHITKENLIQYGLDALKKQKTIPYKQGKPIYAEIKPINQQGGKSQTISLIIVKITEATPLSSKSISVQNKGMLYEEIEGAPTRTRAEAVSKAPPSISFTTGLITTIATVQMGIKRSIAEKGAHEIALELNTIIHNPNPNIKNQNDLRISLIENFKKANINQKWVDRETFFKLAKGQVPGENLTTTTPDFINAHELFNLSTSWENKTIQITITHYTESDIKNFSQAITLFFLDPRVSSILEPFCLLDKKAASHSKEMNSQARNEVGFEELKNRKDVDYFELSYATRNALFQTAKTLPNKMSDDDASAIAEKVTEKLDLIVKRDKTIPDQEELKWDLEKAIFADQTNFNPILFPQLEQVITIFLGDPKVQSVLGQFISPTIR